MLPVRPPCNFVLPIPLVRVLLGPFYGCYMAILNSCAAIKAGPKSRRLKDLGETYPFPARLRKLSLGIPQWSVLKAARTCDGHFEVFATVALLNQQGLFPSVLARLSREQLAHHLQPSLISSPAYKPNILKKNQSLHLSLGQLLLLFESSVTDMEQMRRQLIS